MDDSSNNTDTPRALPLRNRLAFGFGIMLAACFGGAGGLWHKNAHAMQLSPK